MSHLAFERWPHRSDLVHGLVRKTAGVQRAELRGEQPLAQSVRSHAPPTPHLPPITQQAPLLCLRLAGQLTGAATAAI